MAGYFIVKIGTCGPAKDIVFYDRFSALVTVPAVGIIITGVGSVEMANMICRRNLKDYKEAEK